MGHHHEQPACLGSHLVQDAVSISRKANFTGVPWHYSGDVRHSASCPLAPYDNSETTQKPYVPRQEAWKLALSELWPLAAALTSC